MHIHENGGDARLDGGGAWIDGGATGHDVNLDAIPLAPLKICQLWIAKRYDWENDGYGH